MPVQDNGCYECATDAHLHPVARLDGFPEFFDGPAVTDDEKFHDYQNRYGNKNS